MVHFNHAIVRTPSFSHEKGLLSSVYLEGRPNYPKAIVQHEQYIAALAKAGLDVIVLSQNEDFPSSVFVEDVALLTEKVAIISRPGAPTRRAEVEIPDVRETIERFYDEKDIYQIEAPGTVEPGDILMVEDHFYIGISSRTNHEGANQVIAILEKYGYTTEKVELTKKEAMLHLKTGAVYLDNNNILLGGEFKHNKTFKNFNRILVDDDEEYAANSLWINGTVIVPAGYPKTLKTIQDLGYETIVVDMSEYRKVNGSLTCLSLRF